MSRRGNDDGAGDYNETYTDNTQCTEQSRYGESETGGQYKKQSEYGDEGYGKSNEESYGESYGKSNEESYGETKTTEYGGETKIKNEDEEGYEKSNDDSYGSGYNKDNTQENLEDVQDDIDENKKHQHLGTVGAIGAGAYAAYEAHEASEDPENALRHKIEAGVGAALAAGSTGYAIHEHGDKEDAKDEYEQIEENSEGTAKKKHGWFS